MALYPTVPIQIQLTDYELETPHLGVAPIYSVVPVAPPPPPYNPHMYPPLYDVEPPPPPHNLPQFVALVGIHPMHQKESNMSNNETSTRHSTEDKSPSEEKDAKITTKEVILNKKDGKFGMKLAAIHKNIFIYKVTKGSPAAQSGLKLGDQIVKVNGTCVSGLSNDNVHELLRRCPPYGIKFTVRSRGDLTVFKKLGSVKKSFQNL